MAEWRLSIGVTGSTCHPSGRQLPHHCPGCHVAQQPGVQLQACPCRQGSGSLAQAGTLSGHGPSAWVTQTFPRVAGFVCFPSKFKLEEYACNAWLSQAMSAQGTRTFNHPRGPQFRFSSHGQEVLWMAPGLSCL